MRLKQERPTTNPTRHLQVVYRHAVLRLLLSQISRKRPTSKSKTLKRRHSSRSLCAVGRFRCNFADTKRLLLCYNRNKNVTQTCCIWLFILTTSWQADAATICEIAPSASEISSRQNCTSARKYKISLEWPYIIISLRQIGT